jgi:hypothetical protein
MGFPTPFEKELAEEKQHAVMRSSGLLCQRKQNPADFLLTLPPEISRI